MAVNGLRLFLREGSMFEEWDLDIVYLEMGVE